MGIWEGAEMTFPNEQCKIKMAQNLIVTILLCSLSSVNIVNAAGLLANVTKDGRWGREKHLVLPGGRDAALACGKSCGQYSLQGEALEAPSCVGYLGKVPSSGE